jgi:glycosyltransferase involved in cell wall biosynthesis
LANYYRHSSALILPTLLESFTATYLEAMQFDCPVLTSDLDFAREVCGEAAIYFDPWNVDDMCNAILRLRDDPALQRNLRLQGRERLQKVFPDWKHITADALGHLIGFVKHA